VISDILAGFLAGQLEASDEIQAARARIWHRYADALDKWALSIDATLPHVPDHCQQPYHMFYVLLPSLEYRTALIEHMRAAGILAVFHYLPLHLSPMGQRHGGRRGMCPVTEDVSDRLLRLPFYVGLSPAEQDDVIDSILGFNDV